MVLREEHAQVEGLLLDAITSLCESRVTFHNTLAIRAEVVLTADDQEPFCVNLDHVLKTSAAETNCDPHLTSNETPVLTNDNLDINLPASEVNDCTDPAINDDQNSLEQDLQGEAHMQSDEQQNIVGEEATPSETDDISLTLSSIKQEILEAQQENPTETPPTSEIPQIDTKFEVTNGDENDSRDRSPSPEPPSPPPTTLKRKRGRPPKDKSQTKSSEEEEPKEKKPVGQPKKRQKLSKIENGESPLMNKPAGSPRKERVPDEEHPGKKNPVGRPRKQRSPKIPKVKTGTPRPKYKKYTLEEKLEMVKEAEKKGIRATSKLHNIPPSTLVTFKKQNLSQERTKCGRLHGAGRKFSVEHDKIVVEWILAERELNRSPKPESIMKYAKKNVSSDRPHFQASYTWLQKFKRRNCSVLGEKTGNCTKSSSLESATTSNAMLHQASEEDESELAQNNSSAVPECSQMAAGTKPDSVASDRAVTARTLLEQMTESATPVEHAQSMGTDEVSLMDSVFDISTKLTESIESDISTHSPLLTQLKTENSETADYQPIAIQPAASVPPCPPLTRPDGSKTYCNTNLYQS